MNIIKWYNLKLDSSPIITKAVSGSIVFFLGDLLCQGMEIKFLKMDTTYDLKRSLKQASFGLIVAPYLHMQYNYIIPKLFHDKVKYSLIKSIIYATTISDGLFNFAFFMYMSLVRKGDINLALKELPDKFIPVQIMNMKVWPFLTGFNFYFMPFQYRVLFDNTLCIFWNIYLSYIEHKN